jgi:ribosome recycling factor
MADRTIAQQVLAATHQLMRRVAPVSSPTALVAIPVFHEVNLSTIEHLLDATALSPGEVAKRLASPMGWICESCRASTAQQAVALADSARARARSVRAAAAKQVQVGDLPFLKGTEKQRAWANQIRAAHAAASPHSAHLQTKSNAAWWIENRRAL